MTSSVIGALRINLSADTAEFKRKLTQAERTAEKFGRAVGSSLRTGITALAAGATAGAVALAALTKSSFETISAQVDLAKRVGASVAAIQTLQYQTELTGGSSEALAKALGTLNVRLGEAAREGAGPAYEAVKRLGLSIQALTEMDADERIKAISDRMAELGYSTEQQADTLRSLGIRQQEIINLFQEGSAAIDEARAELQAWGVLLSDIDAAKVEAAGDAWDKIKMVLTGVGNQIAIRLAPLISAIADSIGEAAKRAGGFGSVIDAAIGGAVRLFAALQREIYDIRITWDTLVGAFIDGFNTLAGAIPNGVAKLLGMTPEDLGFKAIEHDYGNLINTLAKPPSDEEWEAWLAEIRRKADEAAKALANSKRGQVGDDGVVLTTTEDDLKEIEQYREKLAQKLVALQESLLTERETILAEYDQRLADLENFHNLELLTDQEYQDMLVRSKQETTDKLKKLNDEVTKNQMRNFQQQADAWFDIAGSIASSLETLFGENKALAIAQAVINTAQAITRTLAEYGATPIGWAAAAAAAAAGAAQIATIVRTSKSSKGSGGSIGGGIGRFSQASRGGGNQSQQQPSQPGTSSTLYVNGLTAGTFLSGEVVRELAEKLIEFQRDGGKIVLGPA